jgi:hypothetical protein
VSAQDGTLLWRHKREQPYADVVCPTPIVKGNLVYITVGYNEGSQLLKITAADKKFKAESVYAEKEIGNKQGGVVLVGNLVFGFHEDLAWMLQDFKTGKIELMGKGKRNPRSALKSGAVVAADGRYYAIDETGFFGIIEAKPGSFKQLAKSELPELSKNRKSRGAVWTHPVISDGKLYLRDQELIFCYEIKK